MVTQNSGHKHKKPFRLRTGKRWNAARPKRTERAPQPPPARFARPRLNEDNPFCLLPAEIHHDILLHLPSRDAVSCRRLCQFYTERVEARQLSLAVPQISATIASLEAKVEDLRALRRPITDADSFFDCLNLWFSRRGIFANANECVRSLEKLFGFVFQWERSAVQWIQLALDTVRLQQHLENHGGILHPIDKLRFIDGFGLYAPDISTDMREQIYLRLDSPRSYRFPCPVWAESCFESQSYPNEKKQQWKLTELQDVPRSHDGWEDWVKKPMGISKDLIGPLGLPELPSSVFCYFVQDKWAWRLINKYRAGSGREMNPLMKAAVLEQIRLF